jgi:hypothetical protein
LFPLDRSGSRAVDKRISLAVLQTVNENVRRALVAQLRPAKARVFRNAFYLASSFQRKQNGAGEDI